MQIQWRYILSGLLLLAITVWLAVIFYPDKNLHLIACDVGQGDAILAVYGETQILIDGGPGNKVLKCLEKYVPFWDREIELVVITHPQLDHFEGLIEVFRRYTVNKLLANSIDSGSQAYQLLKNEVGSSSTDVIYPTTGMVIRLDLIQLDILHPTEKFLAANISTPGVAEKTPTGWKILGANTTSKDPNIFSIVAIMSYGEFNALLTGDISPEIGDQLSVNPLIKSVEYIKIPHHGSKNGISSNLLVASSPEVAVISAGKNNRYGHPHQEVIKLLKDPPAGGGIKIMRTDETGDVEIVTDGKSWWMP